MIDDIKAHMDRVCHLTLPSATALPRLVEQHRAILAAIDAREPDRAEAELKTHLSEILKALPQVRADHSDLFI